MLVTRSPFPVLRVALALCLALLCVSDTSQAQFPVLTSTTTTFSVSPATVTGGANATGTIRFPGLNKGAIVFEITSNNAVATVQETVTMLNLAGTASFPIRTSPVASSTTVQIRIVGTNTDRTATFTIVPPVLSGFTLSPGAIVGGNAVIGTVTLSGPAPLISGGPFRIPLFKSFGPSVTMPFVAAVSSGQTSAPFTITTVPVLQAENGTITAGDGETARSVPLTLNPPTVQTMTFASRVVGGRVSTRVVATLNGHQRVSRCRCPAARRE